MAGNNWHSRRAPKSSPLHSSPWPPCSSGEVKMSSWHLVTWCSFFQLLLGIVPKLNAERTPLFSKVKPPCCSIFFFASGRYQEKGEKRRVFKVTKLKTTSKEPDSLYLTLLVLIILPHWALAFNRHSSVSSYVYYCGKIVNNKWN